MKSRKLLVSSLIMILSCCLLFAGTTFAWFSDSVTSNNNIISAGNLDVELEYSTDGTNWDTVDETVALFNSNTWEPGHTEVVLLKVTNAGSLALKYSLSLDVTKEVGSVNLLGENFKLSDYLTVASLVTEDLDTTVIKGRTEAVNFAKENKTGFGSINKNTELVSGDTHYVQLAVVMPEEVGNEANYDSKVAAAPSIEFGVSLFATQLNNESDSFGNDYDDVTMVTSESELLTAVAAGGNVMLATDINVTDKTASIAKGVETNLYLNGKTITATTTKVDKNNDGKLDASDNYNVFYVAAGGKLNIIGNGKVSVVHTGDDMVWNAMTTIAHAYGDITVSEGAELVNYGGTSMAFALNVYSGGNITVEDSFLGSTYCAIRAFDAQQGSLTVVDVKNSSLISYNWNRAFWIQYEANLEVNGILTEAEALEAGNTIYGSVRDTQGVLWVGGQANEYPTYVATAAMLKDALANAETGEVITLAADINFDAENDAIGVPQTLLTVEKENSVVLDLNGHNIASTANVAPTGSISTRYNHALIKVKGSLEVVGNGTLSLTDTGVDMEWNALSAVISVEGGSVVLGEGVSVIHNGGTSMAYGVDVNSTLGETTLVINGATVKSTYTAVRLFNNHKTAACSVVLNSGVVEGENRDIWLHNQNALVGPNGFVTIDPSYSYTYDDNGTYGSIKYYIN